MSRYIRRGGPKSCRRPNARDPGATRKPSACWSVVRVPVVGGAIALALIALSFVVAPTLEDPSHPRYHAVSAIVLLGVAWLEVVRGPSTIARRSVAAASVLLAVAFIFEAVGGFGCDLHGRNQFAVVHDLGLGATALSLLDAAMLLAIAAGTSVASSSSARLLPILATVAAGVIGLFLVKTFVGL